MGKGEGGENKPPIALQSESLFLCFYLFILYWGHACHSAYAEVIGQLAEVITIYTTWF